MNLKLWATLNDAEKKVILEAARVAEDFMNNKWSPYNAEKSTEALAQGAEYTWMPAEDYVKIMEHPAVATQWEDIATEIDEAGGHGTELVNRLLELADKSESEIQKIYDDMWNNRIATLR